MEPKVFLVIVTYNEGCWIKNCLDSLLQTQYSNFEILVVDNVSTDRTRDIIKENFSQVYLRKNAKNLGFSGGANVGIRCALKNNAKYIVLLNADITVEPDWLTSLVEVAEKKPKTGIVSPIQYTYDKTSLDKIFRSIMARNEKFKMDFINNRLHDSYKISQAIGACMLITSELCFKIGLIDPLYFIYHEEADFCRRAKYKGFNIECSTKSRIYHWHRHVNANLNNKTRFYIIRNAFIYKLKDCSRPLFYNIYLLCRYHVKRIRQNYLSKKTFFNYVFFMYIQICVIALLPVIVTKRIHEKEKACYF